MAGHIDIAVRLDARTFRRYCAFDAFQRQRRWHLPAVAAALLICASLAGLFGLVPMSAAASGLLLGLGLAVAMVNLGLYFAAVESQVSCQRLKDAPLVYTLRLDDDGVRIQNGQKAEPPVDVRWGDCFAAYRHGGDVYLYVNSSRALILPEGQANVNSDALWSFIRARLGGEKCFEERRSAR